MTAPENPKIYHILHVDRLKSVISQNGLLSDSRIASQPNAGTNIGAPHIKERRLKSNELASHPGLFVGECVPFYFGVWSPMLYVIHRQGHDLTYNGGQAPIVYLEADLKTTVSWAESHGLKWACTTGNAGASFFDDFSSLSELNKIDWDAVGSKMWKDCRDAKQAEFLVQACFSWSLVERVVVYDNTRHQLVMNEISVADHKPSVQVNPAWYY
ncbi:DUF4433 domain-containing protein [uncultured Pseudoteredinibacter sp.]|uniref:type II toxin-antitoxin system toxin DNA ADP-ribosyl transferase DarT n=1 Tax=uncultured Pseudoteredinibacter sp. TaxID=1641701 RepID=UPI002604C4C1|nr:DUF4433 domain-containing protein [uncultured Pseudoteredinibacter sp.]